MRKKNVLWVAMAAMLLTGCGDKGEQAANEQPTPTVVVGQEIQSGASEDGEADAENAGTEQPTAEPTKEAETLTEKSYQAEEQYVKLLGRTEMYQNIRWLALSASGIEFTFTGTKASITIAADSTLTTGPTNRARFAIYVNGERVVDEQVKKMLETYEVFSADTATETTVKVVKLSEAGNSTIGVKSIDVVCEGDIMPTPEKELKLEFIGDSITCGYGVDDENRNNHFSTATEDATKTYAYKTAMQLDADYSMVCYSGHGIISGYSGDGNQVTTQLVPELYTTSARSSGKFGDFSISDVEWDFSRFVPDAVVINLGTNDDSYVGTNKDRRADYIAGYVEFLKQVREKNPDAHIVCTLGIMGDRLYSAIEEAVTEYQSQTGDEKVSAFHFAPQDGSTGYAADWHPTEATNELAAEAMVAELKKILSLE